MNVAPDTIRCASFFTGAGSLDLGFRIAFPQACTVLYVENEITAAETLAANIEAGAFEDAPIWSDIRTFKAKPWRGRVDCVVAGFPCPDYSVAGKRAGILGKHGQLWDHLAVAIRDMGPSVVCLENVPGILVPHGVGGTEWVLPAGLWFVLGDLASLGFDAEWTMLSAAEIGASHRRLRWWCLAYSRQRIAERWGRSGVFPWAPGEAERDGRERERSGHAAGDEREDLAEPKSRGFGSNREPSGSARQSGGVARVWPTPNATDDRNSGGPRGNPFLRRTAEQWHTPHGMSGMDHTGKVGAGGEFAKQVTNWEPVNDEDLEHPQRT